jgi:hypothetical protein
MESFEEDIGGFRAELTGTLQQVVNLGLRDAG